MLASSSVDTVSSSSTHLGRARFAKSPWPAGNIRHNTRLRPIIVRDMCSFLFVGQQVYCAIPTPRQRYVGCMPVSFPVFPHQT